MTVNEELRDIAIEEYLKEKKQKIERNINRSMKLTLLILAAVFGVVFELLAFKDIYLGRPEDGLEIFAIGIVETALLLLPSCLLVWLILKKRASAEIAAAEEELRKVSYAIEDGSLVRRVAGDGRRTKRYRLEKIRNVSKEGFTVTFDYGNTEVELLECYEPSLFDSLQECI